MRAEFDRTWTITVDGDVREVSRPLWITSDLKKALGIDQARVLAGISHNGLHDYGDSDQVTLYGGERFMTHARSGGAASEPAAEAKSSLEVMLPLAYELAFADYLWSLGESGVMAINPDLAKQALDQAWNGDNVVSEGTRKRWCYIARASNRSAAQSLKEFMDRLGTRLNNHLVEMEPGCDDSITGFNQAWDIVRDAAAGVTSQTPKKSS